MKQPTNQNNVSPTSKRLRPNKSNLFSVCELAERQRDHPDVAVAESVLLPALKGQHRGGISDVELECFVVPLRVRGRARAQGGQEIALHSAFDLD